MIAGTRRRRVRRERWKQIERIFHEALNFGPDEQSAYLDGACGGDAGLRQEVIELLNADGDEELSALLNGIRPVNNITQIEIDKSLIGQTFGHYRFEGLLGSGGMGNVYLAQDVNLRRPVAVKVLPLKMSIDADRMRRFRNEAQATSALNHPNIVTIYDIGESKAGPYIVMELVEGRTLARIEKPVETDQVIYFGGQMARALSVTHAAGITHRDIKPENIMIRNDGYVKILDFGLARLVVSQNTNCRNANTLIHQTVPGSLLGTVAYMSPEQARGESSGPSSDIFSFGIVLYEMVAGRHPFQAGTMVEQLHALIAYDPPSPSTIVPDQPARLDSLIMRMLEKEPHLRPSAVEVAQVFDCLAGRGESSPISVRQRPVVVGREKESLVLKSAYNAAKNGQGGVVCLSGEAGTGKTALIENFLDDLAASGQCTIVRGRCHGRNGCGAPYRPILESLGRLLKDTSNPAASRVMKQVAPAWYALSASVSPRDEASGGLLEHLRSVTSDRMKRELFDFLEDVSRLRPLVLFFDEMQWVDMSTVEILAYLSERFDGLNILILAAHSDLIDSSGINDIDHILSVMTGKGVCKPCRLEGLSLDQVEAWLESEFPCHRFPQGFAELIHLRTGGHPLFLSELAEHLRAGGLIANADRSGSGCTRWGLTGQFDALERSIPDSLAAMIETRIGRIGDEDRAILSAAAVRGHEFEATVIASALGIDPLLVDARLIDIERDQSIIRLVDEYELHDGRMTKRYRFIHSLHRQALERSLEAGRYTELSLALAVALETACGPRVIGMTCEIAALYENGGSYARAADFYHRAAQSAVDVHSNHEAVAFAGRGLRMIEHLPDTDDRARIELMLLAALAGPLASMQGINSAEFQDLYSRTAALSRRLGDATHITLRIQ